MDADKTMDIVFQAELFADGPTRVLRFVDLNTHKGERKSLSYSGKKTVIISHKFFTVSRNKLHNMKLN